MKEIIWALVFVFFAGIATISFTDPMILDGVYHKITGTKHFSETRPFEGMHNLVLEDENDTIKTRD